MTPVAHDAAAPPSALLRLAVFHALLAFHSLSAGEVSCCGLSKEQQHQSRDCARAGNITAAMGKSQQRICITPYDIIW